MSPPVSRHWGSQGAAAFADVGNHTANGAPATSVPHNAAPTASYGYQPPAGAYQAAPPMGGYGEPPPSGALPYATAPPKFV